MNDTTSTVVRYAVHPDRVEENTRLVRAVYDELHRERPAGLRYATFHLDDGTGFVHVASGDDALPSLPAFRAFVAGVGERAVEPPLVSSARAVGTYRAFGGGAAPVATAYLDAWCAGDFDRARELVAEDLAFEGPMSSSTGREEFFALSEPLRPLLGGHRVLMQWDDGDECCVAYELRLGGATVPMTDWITVRDGLVATDRVLFDTAAFTAAVSTSR